ncbi:MAG: hypothetical protein RIB58_01475 [Phycisphaerales bacterium]
MAKKPTHIKSKRGLLNAHGNCTKPVNEYFKHIPSLLEYYPLEVCLAYVFARLELGQNMCLYCGVVRLHKVDTTVARGAVATHHMTRESFVSLYKTVYGLDLPKEALADLKQAEKIRDKVIHGKPSDDNSVRNAIARVLEFAEDVNEQLDTEHGLKPFGDLRGFSGRSKKLDGRTSRFILKGMGFAIA